jgi:hypothetical protein
MDRIYKVILKLVCIPLFEEETIIYYVWRIDVCGAEN